MIPVLWWSDSRMSFSCCASLNAMFDAYSCQHFTRFDGPRPQFDGAILVFHGGHSCVGDMGSRNAQLLNIVASEWRWVIFVSIGDEATEFPYHLLHHDNMKLWVQAPLPTTRADRYLIQGCPEHCAHVNVPRELDYFFSGQTTHERRDQCHRALIRYWESNANGIILTTRAFGQGLPYPDYLRFMSRARIAPCPAGLSTPDTFRVYEALECGAIPILDARSLRPATEGVWPLLLGADHPLPIVSDWSTLPDVMSSLLADWHNLSPLVQRWWEFYKSQFRLWLAQDLISLGAPISTEVTA